MNGILITKAKVYTAYISTQLHFIFWKSFYYKVGESNLPSDSTEKCCHWVGITEHVGYDTNFKVITDDTQKVLFCSNLCPTDYPM